MKGKINYVSLLFLFLILGLSIVFSDFSRNLAIQDLAAKIRVVKDLRITGIIPSGSTSDGLAVNEDYNISNITSSFYLPNASSTVTYTIEVTNIGNMGGFTTYCADSAWMKQSSAMWTVTPRMNENNKAWYIKSTGGTDYSSVITSSYLLIPTVYLNSNTTFVAGDGSSGNPFRIYLS